MAKKTQHYTVDNKNKIVRAYIARLTEKEKKEIKNYLDLGYTLIAEEEPVKRTLTKEEREEEQKQKEKEQKENPFSEINIQKFLKEKATQEQQKNYWELYNEQAKDKKTNLPAVYKTDSKKNSKKQFKAGDPKPKGHIATLQWFKTEFPNYPAEK